MGCSTENLNISTSFKGETDGILGMDASPFSLVSQTYSASKGRFSYCLVKDGLTPPVLSSYLRFGDDIVLGLPPWIKVQTCPLVQHIAFRYALNLLDISVGKNKIGGFELNDSFPVNTKNGFGACELDTGAQISFLDTIVYGKVKGALMKGFQTLRLKILDAKKYYLDLCYELPGDFKSFPSITYHFQGGDLKIPSDNAFIIDYPNKFFCLAIKPKIGQNVLGAKQQRNIRFVFDINRDVVSFYPEDCSKDLQK
ncbi:aspartic proteinase nepenthesin-1-like [Papaver somniferum]|uniref:aspartic proteinase nepenthesin-1-like n=1 Tax=Papaver somniferum TaxID=3469 RepID=UPI000E703BB8|nr:aspartic proteinase nepenthesin-1-like [Papaver somniferum]